MVLKVLEDGWSVTFHGFIFGLHKYSFFRIIIYQWKILVVDIFYPLQKSGLPWLAPKKSIDFGDLKEAISSAFGV